MDLSGQTVLVTGGSSGIGRAISLTAAEYGADIVVADLQEDPRGGGSPTTELVSELGQQSTYVETDVTNRGDLTTAVRECHKFGGIDGLVNNAGFAQSHALLDTSAENWTRSVETNLTGTFNGCLAAVPEMLESGGGAIVNIASGAGIVGLVNSCSYSASKGGVIALTRQIAVDYANDGIRANSVSPGFTDTAMFRKDTHDGTRTYAQQSTPMGRVAEPEEIADATVFLLSDSASFITGDNLLVDGGYVIQ